MLASNEFDLHSNGHKKGGEPDNHETGGAAPGDQKDITPRGDVLIVDDDPDAREILSRILAQLNLPSRSAKNGVEALARIEEKIPALILLDIMMPLMDGFAVLSRLRANPHTRYVPVIIVTGMSIGTEMLDLPGVAKVMRKSDFSIPKMLSAITTVLHKK